RRAAAQTADPRLSEKDADRYAEITGGLKVIQIASILTPPPPAVEETAEREAFLAGILGGGPDAAERAHRLAALTDGLPHEEIRKLLAPGAAAPAQPQASSAASRPPGAPARRSPPRGDPEAPRPGSGGARQPRGLLSRAPAAGRRPADRAAQAR